VHFGRQHVKFEVRAEPHQLPVVYGKSLGLIINELVVNALKYAFLGDRGGTVLISFTCVDDHYTLTVQGDGIGVDPTAAPRGTGLGRRLVRALAAQFLAERIVSQFEGLSSRQEPRFNWRKSNVGRAKKRYWRNG